MRSYDLYFSFTNRSTEVKYHVQVVQQPWYRALIANVYHWYDMHIFKVPGFRKFEDWHYRRASRNGDVLTAIPISAEQDIKCHFLSNQDKQVIATFEVDRATYIKLGGPEHTPENNN